MAGNIAAGIAQSVGYPQLVFPETSPWVNENVRKAVALASVDIAEGIIAEVDRRVAPLPKPVAMPLPDDGMPR